MDWLRIHGPRIRYTTLLLCAVGALMTPSRPAQAAALRPTTITWGGFSNNGQLVGAQNEWPFVQQYIDGYVMHGAYWISKRDYGGPIPEAQWLATLQALGQALGRWHKPVSVETSLAERPGYSQGDPNTREAVTEARKDIAAFTVFAQYGIKVSKVRVDWLPLCAAAVYAQKYRTTDSRALLLMMTGNKIFGSFPAFDPAEANWTEYARTISAALPGVELGFDQAPCNFPAVIADPAIRAVVPWEGVGYGYKSAGIVDERHKPALVNGAPVAVNIDFADLMMSVATATRDAGYNYYGFEGDTPFKYLTGNLGRSGTDLMPLLLHIERLQHRYGFHNGKIINDTSFPKGISNDAWDKLYHDRTLQFLEYYQEHGGRADQYIAESWYSGPYKLFPETEPNTFSNLARDLIRRVRGIDDHGARYHASLSILPSGSPRAVTASVRGRQVRLSVGEHGSAVVTLRVRNDGTTVLPGDCLATMLLRAEERGAPGWTVHYRAAGQTVDSDVTARGDSDGWWVGGLQPGQSKTIDVTFATSPSARARSTRIVNLSLYWNPQDPSVKPRDTVTLVATRA